MAINQKPKKGAAAGARTAAQKQYSSDSLNLANNWRTMNNKKSKPKDLDDAENTINSINEKYDSKKIGRAHV